MGNYPEAKTNYLKALAICEKSLPSDHPELATSYNNLGSVEYFMGNSPDLTGVAGSRSGQTGSFHLSSRAGRDVEAADYVRDDSEDITLWYGVLKTDVGTPPTPCATSTSTAPAAAASLRQRFTSPEYKI